MQVRHGGVGGELDGMARLQVGIVGGLGSAAVAARPGSGFAPGAAAGGEAVLGQGCGVEAEWDQRQVARERKRTECIEKIVAQHRSAPLPGAVSRAVGRLGGSGVVSCHCFTLGAALQCFARAGGGLSEERQRWTIGSMPEEIKPKSPRPARRGLPTQSARRSRSCGWTCCWCSRGWRRRASRRSG